MKTDVVLVTCDELRSAPDPDDVILRDALLASGRSVAVVPWDDAAFDWSSARFALLRSTWDYYKRRDEFLAWMAKASALTDLWNRTDVVRWNTHKGYLLELEAKGIPIVPTVIVKQGQRPDLDRVMAERRWNRLVIKPAVSAGSYRTTRVDPANVHEGREHLAALVKDVDAMIQPYMPTVEGYGERSMIVIDGKLTHAVRKRPAFGTQGGAAAAFEPGKEVLENAKVDPAQPMEDEEEAAENVLAAAKLDLLYARVDLVRDVEGTPRVMELELTEPSLFLWNSDAAKERLVGAIQTRLG